MNQLIYEQQLHYDLTDFDNHLDDVSKDWSNKALNENIDSIVSTLQVWFGIVINC